MNIRKNIGRRVGEAVFGGNQTLPQAPTTTVQVPIKPTALTNGEVRAALVQIAQAITVQAQAITAQATRDGAPRENPHASTMVAC